jgi:hypothetical protein
VVRKTPKPSIKVIVQGGTLLEGEIMRGSSRIILIEHLRHDT